MDGAETEGSPQAVSEAASDVPNAEADTYQDVSASRSAASTQPPLDLRTVGHHIRTSTDSGSIHRQIQQTSLLRHHEASISSAAQQSSWLTGTGGKLTAASGLTMDSHASAAMRQPSISLSAPAIGSHTFSRQEAQAAALKPPIPSRPEKTSFLVQQPSSKLWMEAVPMRVGTKATTTYRVYSNAFMEGRQQESRLARSTARTGIPSIQSTSAVLRQAAWSRSGALATSGGPARQDAPRRGMPDSRGVQPGPPQRQASFDLKQSGHAVAERMLQRGYVVRPRREDLALESQDVAVSAASTGDALRHGGAPFRRRDSGSPPGAAEASTKQAAAAKSDQERQLAALLSMPDLSSASLLSSAEAQGSSNLIYILKTLQDHGGMNPHRLLQQLQAAMKESPMQQALLMHMLQESLAAPSQPQAPNRQETEVRDRESHRHESLQDRYREPDRPSVSPRHAEAPASQQRPSSKRISHEEMEASMRRMGPEGEKVAAPGRGPKPGSMSRLGREPGPGPPRHSRTPPLQGHSAQERAAHRPLPAAQPEAPSAKLPRLVFRDAPAPSEQQKRLNPFEGLRMQQYKAAARGAGAAARPAATNATEAPKAAAREHGQPAAAPAGPATAEAADAQPAAGRTKEDNLREAAKMLLCLNSTEPVARGDQVPPHAGDALPTAVAAAAAAQQLSAAGAESSEAAGNVATVSPLQALVQDIMQQQKQRAQESALAKLPTGVSRVERRAGDRPPPPPAPPASDKDAFSPPAPAPSPTQAPTPGRKRVPRMMGLNSIRDTPPEAIMEDVPEAGLQREPSGNRFNILGFVVPSAPRTGHVSRDTAQPPVELPPPTRHAGYGPVEGTRRKQSGSVGESSGGKSEPGGPAARSGTSSLNAPAERRVSHSLSGRRVTRPVLLDSSGDFMEDSSGDVQSTDSESWDTSKEPKHRRRRRKR